MRLKSIIQSWQSHPKSLKWILSDDGCGNTSSTPNCRKMWNEWTKGAWCVDNIGLCLHRLEFTTGLTPHHGWSHSSFANSFACDVAWMVKSLWFMRGSLTATSIPWSLTASRALRYRITISPFHLTEHDSQTTDWSGLFEMVQSQIHMHVIC